MLLCSKCRVPIEDVSDSCKQCKHFKTKLTVRDSDAGENSITGDINETRKLIRNHLRHLEHVHKMQLKKGADSYDPQLVDAIVKLSKASNDTGKMLRLIQGDTQRTMASMSSGDRLRLIAKVIANMPEADKLAVLKMADDPKLSDTPTLKPFRENN